MLRNSLIAAVAALLATGAVLAQAPPPGTNAHQSQEQRLRACRREAAEQGLAGEARRAFIAECTRT